MYLTDRVAAAMRMAYRLHHGQYDKAGLPYIFHPYRVAEKMRKYRTMNVESLTVVALLHDVVEDTSVTIDSIRTVAQAYYGLWLTDEEVRWIDAVSRRVGEKYADFIERTMQEPESRVVKFEDVADNLGRELIGEPLPASLVARYEKAYNRLKGL